MEFTGMKPPIATRLILTTLLAASGLLAFAAPAHATETLTVFAAASLSESFTEIGRAFEKADPGVTVRFNFAGSQQLAAQLEQGAVADVFASADMRWLQYVGELGKLAGVPCVFAGNRIVVIVPKKNPAHIERLRDLERHGVKIVMATPAAPVGRYAGAVLAKLAHTPGFPPDFPKRVRDNVVSQEENVKAVVAKVQLGEADAGFVYHTDVTPEVARQVRVFEIPDRAQAQVTYPVGVLKDAPQSEAAQAFVDFLLGQEGQEILKRHGLLPPPVPVSATPPAPADSAAHR
jgi:molybdate transport system substrate-binding protein